MCEIKVYTYIYVVYRGGEASQFMKGLMTTTFASVVHEYSKARADNFIFNHRQQNVSVLL